MRDVLLVYLILLNAAAFATYGIDKWKAVHNRWRTPEKTLLGLALLGGSAGAFLAMHLFRHKIRKPKFAIGVPVVFWLQLALGGYLFLYVFR